MRSECSSSSEWAGDHRHSAELRAGLPTLEGDPVKVVVIGAGIGGSTAATALMQRDHEVAVFDAAPKPTHIGGGMFVWTNALRVLRPLGLSEPIEDLGEHINRFQFVTYRGRTLMDWPLDELGDKLGAPTVCVERGKLLGALLDALPPGVVTYGEECVGFEQDQSGVSVRFASGREESCDMLVGADGRESALRRLMGKPMELRPFGVSAWRATIPFERDETNPEGIVRSHFGIGCHFIYQPVKGGRQFWSAAKPAEPGDEQEDRPKQALLERYRDFCPPVLRMIESTDESEIVRTEFVDRPTTEQWSDGRVTLLGDAAHTMAPNAGQGACQAIEDAVVLAECLAGDGEVADRLRAYEARRIPRTSNVTDAAHRNAKSLRLKGRIPCTVRAAALRLMSAPAFRQWERMVGAPI
jgi:2-polyprenyl-6-methoxyphenol hydroxylase-like FAD-dependent oxidoreductase